MPSNPSHRRFMRVVGGMAVGLLIAIGVTETGALQEIATWRPDEWVSTALGGILLMIAAITGPGSINRKTYRVLTDEGLGDPVEPETLTMLRRQSLITALMGLLLIIPPAAAHLGFTGVAAVGPVIVMLALVGWQAWLHLRLMRDGDELNRAVMTESGSASFLVCGLALFGWAALKKLALLPGLDSWTMVSAVMVLSFAVSTVVSVRRGMIGR